MSTITAWEESLARPTEGEKIFYLTEHLEGVRNKAHSFFTKKAGFKSTAGGMPEQCLLELAAICHDIGKAHHDWQRYIRGRSSRGPTHAESGAVFFAYLAYHYLQHEELWEDYQYLWLFITRDLADHHGTLKGFAHNNNLYSDAFFKMDMEGLSNWLFDQFPELEECGVEIEAESIADWQGEYPYIVEEVINNLYDKVEEQSIDELMDSLQQWRMLTTLLMASDRFDIEPVQDDRFQLSDWQRVEESIQHFCLGGNDHPLGKIRSQAQESILEQWTRNRDDSFYVLEMPTGYGKTVTALKLATAIAQDRQLSKIIYVAPYLSILEQNAVELEKALGHKPLQHHSMAMMLEGVHKSKKGKQTALQEGRLLDENEHSDQLSDLDVQSWADKIVCTSFVQWMKAIFPRRAQETLRRIFLQDAVVIIDEPQIIDEMVWNLFLKGVASLSRLYNLTVIFCSATMPPFTYGLSNDPIKLSVSSKGGVNRYQIKLTEPIDAEECALKLAEVDEPSSVAIVNTIYDACHLFHKLPDCSQTERYLLHGLMIPLHKKIQLEKIEEALKEQRKGERAKRIQVISTQILEAGVNLSFHYMFRALPILPALTQAAGRTNRHGEKSMGTVETGKFLRNGQDTRFIYPKNLCRLSDELLFEKEVWMEEEMASLVTSFYERMFAENSYEAVLEDIKKAIEGNWERLSRHEVYDNKEYYRLPIFVPYDWQEEEALLTEGMKRLLAEFQVTSATDIYELFRDHQRKQAWNFHDRKRFSALFNQFVLQVPVNIALKLVPKDDFLRYRIPLLENLESYSNTRGLIMLEDEIEDSFI